MTVFSPKTLTALGYTLISNHAFVDGNERISMYVMFKSSSLNQTP